VSLDEVEEWLSVKIPRARAWLVEQVGYHDAEMQFELWTTSTFDPEAVALLNQRKSTTKKIDWKDGEEVVRTAKGARTTHLVNTPRQHTSSTHFASTT
jgi:hypothetical protein